MMNNNYLKGIYFTKNEIKNRLRKMGIETKSDNKKELNSIYDIALQDDSKKEKLSPDLLKEPEKSKEKRSLNLIEEDSDEKEDKLVKLNQYDFNDLFSKPHTSIAKFIDPKKHNCSFSINTNINVIESGGCLNKVNHSSSIQSGLFGFGLGATATSAFYFLPNNSLHTLRERLTSLSLNSIETLRPYVDSIYRILNDISTKISSNDVYTLLLIIFIVLILVFIVRGVWKSMHRKEKKM